MTSYIVIFQIGPVQDFIHTARRTDDYWAGSFLLSFATAHAINLVTVRGGEIIFPDPTGNSLVEAVTRDEFKTPESLFPSLPNRLGARMNSDGPNTLKSALAEIKADLLSVLVSRFETVERQLTGETNLSKRHIGDLFECFYAFAEDGPDTPCAAFDLAERRLAARKTIRDFTPFDQIGFKCTQCGVREPLQKGADSALSDLKGYWKTIRSREQGRYRYVFKENERLCPVCAGKRLLRRLCFGGGAIPSTSTIAVSAWLTQIEGDSTAPSADPTAPANVLSTFSMALKKAFPRQDMAPVPANRKKHTPLFKIEGDNFIDDAYDRFEKEARDEGKPERMASIGEARKRLKEFLAGLPRNLRTPPRYFTILAFDGDNMGDYKRTLTSCADHQEFSRQLASFSSTVYQIVHDSYHGYVIYAGGDEGVALIPLSETLKVMDDLRKAFNQLKDGPTLSAGAAIVHHQAPLGMGLKAATDALENHAKKVRGKNAFSICIRKRSGAHDICQAPWETPTEAGTQDMIDFLGKWETAYHDGLSPRWYHRMYSDLPVIRENERRYDQAMAENLFFHLLPRQSPESDKGLGLSMAKEIQNIMGGHEAFDNIDNLLSLLYVPIYLFKGGAD